MASPVFKTGLAGIAFAGRFDSFPPPPQFSPIWSNFSVQCHQNPKGRGQTVPHGILSPARAASEIFRNPWTLALVNKLGVGWALINIMEVTVM